MSLIARNSEKCAKLRGIGRGKRGIGSICACYLAYTANTMFYIVDYHRLSTSVTLDRIADAKVFNAVDTWRFPAGYDIHFTVHLVLLYIQPDLIYVTIQGHMKNGALR